MSTAIEVMHEYDSRHNNYMHLNNHVVSICCIRVTHYGVVKHKYDIDNTMYVVNIPPVIS